ncbi:methyltransferase domain protein [Ceratobasidium sp. AG-Ba]|nr:methyltransferase domain protein [Ceratobasidium sp. AG-Ba]
MPVYTYYDPDTDGEVYHVVPDSDQDDYVSTLESQTESMDSCTTIQSDELPEQETDVPLEGYFVVHNGRQQPAIDNVAKFFPTDNVRRYILKYFIDKSLLGGDYLGPVRDVLAPVRGREKYVLDLRTTTGTWTQSMAAEFPHVQFRSVDIVPIISHIQRPNITFEAYDFTEGLMLEDESQDAVFINHVGEMWYKQVKDYPALLRESHRVLRPGGFVHIVEHQVQGWGPENMSELSHRTNPIGCRFLEIAREQMSVVEIDPDAPIKIAGWLASNSNVWRGVKRQNVGFERIESVVRAYPVYPHDGFPCASSVEAHMIPFIRNLTMNSVQDLFSALRDRGIEKEKAEQMIEAAIDEAKQPERKIE